MKKVIFKSLLLSIGVLLLSAHGQAQNTNSARSAASKTLTNQTKATGSEQGWRQLFNGKDLTGWKHVGKGDMVVDSGLIHGKSGMGLLYWTKEKFSNCT